MSRRGRLVRASAAGRSRRGATGAAVLAPVLVCGALAAACGPVDGARDELEGVVATDDDWRIVAEKVRWARSRGLDTLPVGESVARIGLSFVGTAYVPKTLEVEGPERTVVNLRGLDCVTFVETVLALDRVARDRSVPGEDGRALRRAYADAVTRLRYRSGVRDGYASRLHYFSEWIRDGERKGLLREVTAELGGVRDSSTVNFMSEHPDAYRQLEDPGTFDAIRAVEADLARAPRWHLPEGALEAAAAGIRSGDVIAATSTVEGLDVAHTGLAVRRDGELRLLHAPLVGDSVQVSERALPERITALEAQDGVMVARPLPPERRRRGASE